MSCPTIANVKTWDTLIVGGGIIGVSLAISLRKKGLNVLVVEREGLGGEASYAAAGMLVGDGAEVPDALRPLAAESARMYPEFVHELEDESGVKIDLREQGTILVSDGSEFPDSARRISAEDLESLEPALHDVPGGRGRSPLENDGGCLAAYLPERSVDPRTLMTAAVKAARHRGVDISSGSKVTELLIAGGRIAGVKTNKTSYSSAIVVNCAGAWAGQIAPHEFPLRPVPVRPVKGQMLAVVNGPKLRHVIRGDKVYLVPRSDGRIVTGSTLEEAGFNKQTDVDTIEKLFHSAIELVPALAGARQHEAWAGLRPGTPDGLPILGETSLSGYYVATGHYRDGILLAPVTAQAMTDVILQRPLSCELAAFSAARFVPENSFARKIRGTKN